MSDRQARRLFGVYGASGFGREVMPVARSAVMRTAAAGDEIVFIDDGAEHREVNGQRVLSYEEFLAAAGEKFVSVAIAHAATREGIAARCAAAGLRAWTVVADTVVVMDQVALGEGAILQPFVTVTSNVVIGRYFHANIYSYVAHDCVIGDFVTFAPGVKCNGNVHVEDHAYVGTGAVIRQGTPGAPIVIGRGATVGMGAVVTRSVAPGTTVVGNPARPMGAG